MNFTGNLGIYKIIETEDRTKTIWSEYFDEACHNLSGAYEETLHNYIVGCHIQEQLMSIGPVHILDVGFGVGVGLLAFIDQLKTLKDTPLKDISYTSIELDEEFFLWSMKETLPFLKLEKNANQYTGVYNSPLAPLISLEIKIYIGDGRVTLTQDQKNLKKFTAIFQDAFSPKKNPTLWTTEWFIFLRENSAKNVELSTYSSSISIRKSLLAAGWHIENAKGFGQKRTMTKANLLHPTDPLILNELKRSPALELHDK